MASMLVAHEGLKTAPLGMAGKGFSLSVVFVVIVVVQSCLTLYDLMDYSTQASLSFTISWSLLKLMSIELVMSSSHLILCCPFLL